MQGQPAPRHDAPRPDHQTGGRGTFGQKLGLLARSAAFPLLLFAALVGLTLALWSHELSRHARDVDQDTHFIRVQLARRFERIVEARTRPLQILAIESERLPLKDFRAAAQTTCELLPGCVSIAWLDRQGQTVFTVGGMPPPTMDAVASPEATPQDSVDSPHGAVPGWSELWQTIRARPVPTVSRVYDDPQGQALIAIIVPVLARGRSTPGPASAVACEASLDSLLERAMDPALRRDFDVRLHDGHRTVFRSPAALAWNGTRTQAELVNLPEATWVLHTRPSVSGFAPAGQRATTWALWGGLAASFLVSFAVFLAQHYRRRDVALAHGYSRAMERLHAVSAAISARLGSGQDVLQQLVQAARDLLHMSRVTIAVLDHPEPSSRPSLGSTPPQANLDEAVVHVITSVGWQPSIVGTRMPLKSLPTALRAIARRSVILVPDTERSDLSGELFRVYKVRSAMLIPLLVEGNVIGLMTLADPSPRRFKLQDQRLAELWGAQAAVTLANAQLHQRAKEALRAQQELLEQREKLAEVTAAVHARRDLDGTLRAITELTPSVLGVDLCGVSLLTETDGELLIVAATPPHDRVVGQRVRTPYPPVERMLATGEPRIVTDVAAEAELDPVWKQLPDAGSFVSLPLYFGDRRPLGVLTLVRYARGEFSRQQIELAWAFAARAATAIENARLHEQTHRDAQAKAMLLRELNHRVKNNLARIAGLLAVEENNVPPDARSSLSRLGQRVRMMASTHELFAGGVTAIGLGELVRQVLASLAVARPANVEVRLVLEEPGVTLGTDQAVALATVLHELAFNAIVHGMNQGGVLEIRARRNGDGRLKLEMLDDGCGIDRATANATDGGEIQRDNARDPSARSGMGLQLVSGLVRRELHGQFSIGRRGDGSGTCAVVEFPLGGEPRREELQ